MLSCELGLPSSSVKKRHISKIFRNVKSRYYQDHLPPELEDDVKVKMVSGAVCLCQKWLSYHTQTFQFVCFLAELSFLS